MFYKKYKSILSPQNAMNIYRGCTHGCIYCDSRSDCYQINHEFADIEIKEDAPKLLDFELSNKRKPCMVGTGSMTDPYNHVEKEIQYTRQCLEVILKHHCGVGVLTKSDLILRDLDLIYKINKDSKAVVQITLTTFDDELCKKIEPNVCPTSKRIEVLKKCQELGIPTVVWLCPFLPFINDTFDNITNLVDACIKVGVKGIIFFGVGLTLRQGNREYFYECLEKDFPGIKEKYIKQFGTSYQINSPNHDALKQIIIDKCRKNNIMIDINEVFSYMRKYPEPFEQLDLFSLNK
jgi:DNA repair photolyase